MQPNNLGVTEHSITQCFGARTSQHIQQAAATLGISEVGVNQRFRAFQLGVKGKLHHPMAIKHTALYVLNKE